MARVSIVMSLKTLAVTSAGFSTEPNAGMIFRSAACVASENGGSTRPPVVARSANTMLDPPEIDSTPIRGPFGRRP